jgi:hypothetical protein
MAVFRLLFVGILLSRELSRREVTRSEMPYEALNLAVRPLPAGLQLQRHPREISAERVREITGGQIG